MLIITGFGSITKPWDSRFLDAHIYLTLNPHLHLLRSSARCHWRRLGECVTSNIRQTSPKLSSVNPYRLISVHDHFGANASLDNPPVSVAELRTVTIIGLYPKGSPAIPAWVKEESWQRTGTDFLMPVRNGVPMVLITR